MSAVSVKSSKCALFVDRAELARLAPADADDRLAQAAALAARYGSLAIRRVFGPSTGNEFGVSTEDGEPVAVQLAVEALAVALGQPSIGTLCFLTPPATLRPLFLKLRGYGRRVIVIGPPDPGLSDNLAGACQAYVAWETGADDTAAASNVACPPVVTDMASAAHTAVVPLGAGIATLRARIEARFRLALPPRVERERIYAAAERALAALDDWDAAIPLVDLSYRVSELLEGAIPQPVVFKILYTLVLGQTFQARRGERPHLIRVQSARCPMTEWDMRLIQVCLLHVDEPTAGLSALSAELGELFEQDPATIARALVRSSDAGGAK